MALDTAAHPQEFLHQHAPGSGETEIILVLAHELKKRSPTKSEFAQLVDLLRVPGASAMNVNKLCEETKEHPVILELKERRLGATNAVMTLNLAWLALQGTAGLEPTGPGREDRKKGWRVEGGEWRTKHLTLQKKKASAEAQLETARQQALACEERGLEYQREAKMAHTCLRSVERQAAESEHRNASFI